MNKTFSVEQISRTGNINANLLLRPHKLDLMTRIKEIKSINPKMKQKEIATELGYSSCTLQSSR